MTPQSASTLFVPMLLRLAGVTFLWAGTLKAIAPHTFRAHVNSLGILPARFVTSFVNAAATLEVAWGISLIVAFAWWFVLPATIVGLVALSIVSLWGVRAGKAKDCGCYGGFVQPSIAQSIGLNATITTLAALALLNDTSQSSAPLWKFTVVVAGAVIAGAFAAYAQNYEQKNGRILVDTRPIKVGSRWNDKWADGATRGMSGEILVGFLGASCPHCADFVRVANTIVRSPALPSVVGVMGVSPDEAQRYSEEKSIRFPVATISASLMGRLTYAVPTAALIKDGVIEAMWVGGLPPSFVDRFRDAFFPGLEKPPAAKANHL